MTTVRLVDSTLRDGSHAVAHTFTPDQVEHVSKALNAAGVWAIAVGHGDGLGAASIQYGYPTHSDEELIAAAAAQANRAKVAVVLVPGIGTKRELELAFNSGASLARIATVCTEADVILQHIGMAKRLGMEAHGMLAMANIKPADELANYARMLAEAGSDAIYIVDTAGCMLPDEVRSRVSALRDALPEDISIGIHAHNNLSVAISNSIAAIQEGATLIDVALAGMGAGAGNCQAEALVAVCEKMGIETGVDLFAVQDAADDYVRPDLMPGPAQIDRLSATLGYAGVPAAFLLHVQRAAARFNVDPRRVIVALGANNSVIGQEDLIIDIAASLAAEAQVVGQP